MTLLHFRMRRRLGLLAFGALEGSEREAVVAHVRGCPRCRAELESLRDVLALVARDSVREAEPALPVESLLARVNAKLDAGRAPSGGRAPYGGRAPHGSRGSSPAWRWALLPLAAAAVLAFAVFLPRPPLPDVTLVQVPEDMLERLEANAARGQAVRYLSEAQDVLVTVASLPRNCDREPERVDLSAESARSRELLVRGTLLVDADRAPLAGVRPVLDDVEDMLRQVASLESCVRRGDVERVRAEMEKRQLLMKIKLMTRELEG